MLAGRAVDELWSASPRPAHLPSTSQPVGLSMDLTVSHQRRPTVSESDSNTDSATMYRHVCPSCNDYHRLFAFQNFKSMKSLDRLNFVKSKKLCENCLLGNHNTSDCRKPGRCTVCGAKHTIVNDVFSSNISNSHGNESATVATNVEASNQDSENTNTVFASKTNVSHNAVHETKCNVSKQVLLPVVPVVVNDCYNTFALLDSASTNSFCSQELVNALNIKGIKTVLNLSTLERSSSERVTEAVSFSLRGGDEMFQMSNVYVIESVPVPIVENYAASSCEHLRGIQLPLADKVDILIGQDCPEVLIPHEVRRGAKDEPYAIRTCLVWSVCGPLGGSNKANVKTFANFIKLDKQVEQMWQLDNELLSEERAMSLQDQAVITLWEEKGKLINGHYELPIPWMRKVNDERRPNIANNKDQAVEHFHGLKRRLEKDMTLKEGYTQGIKMLLDKGYAEPVPTTDLFRMMDKCFIYYIIPFKVSLKTKYV